MNIEEKSLLAEEYHKYLEAITLIATETFDPDNFSPQNLAEALVYAKAAIFVQNSLNEEGNTPLPSFDAFCESLRSLLGEELFEAEMQAILQER